MIVPMKKVSLVVMEKNREVSLEKLREAGVLHLEKRNVRSDELTKLLDRKAKVETALGVLQSYPEEKRASGKIPADEQEKAGAVPQDVFSSEAINGDAPPDVVSRVLELGDEKKTLQEQILVHTKERSRIEKWGNFDPRAFAEFAEKGIVLIPYELSLKGHESLPEGLIALGQDK
ncbi:MAG: V-type ATP synthase subunit I, partial [Spirochaetaceae bacterium]|nr:V-type ATP synthase subunit I [Spirochaetaceae bacterium]